MFYSTPKIDLKKNHDKCVSVNGGKLYIKSNIVQVWWNDNCHETWTNQTQSEAQSNFASMVERWKDEKAND